MAFDQTTEAFTLLKHWGCHENWICVIYDNCNSVPVWSFSQAISVTPEIGYTVMGDPTNTPDVVDCSNWFTKCISNVVAGFFISTFFFIVILFLHFKNHFLQEKVLTVFIMQYANEMTSHGGF